MTPNKLPPLPDLIEKALKRAFCLGQTYWQQADSQYTSDHKRADVTMEKFKALAGETLESAEALRQSQSLPAGAVAGLAAQLRQMACWCKSSEDDDGTGTFIPAYASGDVFDILTQAALQADAREKGEAVSALVRKRLSDLACAAIESDDDWYSADKLAHETPRAIASAAAEFIAYASPRLILAILRDSKDAK